MSTSWYPCTCQHKVNCHDLAEFPNNVGACDEPGCLCQDYREDLQREIYVGAMGWMLSDSPTDEQHAFACFCLDYYQDEDTLEIVNYRNAWNAYLDRLSETA